MAHQKLTDYKIMIGLKFPASSRAEALAFVWKQLEQVPELRQYVQWVGGGEIKPQGWLRQTINQLTGK